MGRKNQQKINSMKARNKHNLNQQHELRENVDNLLKLSAILPNQQFNVNKALESQKEIFKVIDKIKNIELNNSNKLPTNLERITNDKKTSFINWLKQNGAIFDGCTIAEFPGYDLGLKAEIDIPFGSLFIAVPKKLMLTVESAKNSPLKNLVIKDQILKNMPNVALAIYLLVEKFSENSFYKPYIDILPQKYNTVLYFSLEELEELRGSPTLEIALKQIKSIARQYAYFHTVFSSREDNVSKMLRPFFSFEEYCWAVSTVMTRQNTIPPEDGNDPISALIPLWDLCNHTNGTISTDFNPGLKRSECLALKDFKVGEQLFIFYGPRSNAEFFIHNGFVPDDNCYDFYNLRLGISKSDHLYGKRTQILEKLSLDNVHEFCLKKNIESIDGKLLAFVRIFNMNEDQLSHWIESDKVGDLEYIECALDTTLEKKAWTFLLNRLKLILATYKTTLEEDLSILNGNTLSSNSLLAIKMRVSEKKIITEWIQWVEQHIVQ